MSYAVAAFFLADLGSDVEPGEVGTNPGLPSRELGICSFWPGVVNIIILEKQVSKIVIFML